MYRDDIKLFGKKEKRIGNLNTGSEDINSDCRDGIWHGKMCHEKWKNGKWWKELNYQIKKKSERSEIKKKNYKYLGILVVDTIK